ncbi:ABC transporter ATP-binding protein [Desulfobacula sp.]|uniref:ABC transporter ATP-binding protein n=1 Tax=Desulfobacula sp. TaxID=2593537 RepID=UPI00261A6BCB|nr:ABC transporter ATP-binding protein [Desulfobacula sp.]
MITINNLHFMYNDHSGIKNVNLKIEPNEVVSLLGPNGSGKTTLLKSIYGLLNPKKGRIYLDCKLISTIKSSELAKIVGGVPQDHQNSFPYKVLDLVVMGRTPYLSIFSSPLQEDYQKGRKILSELGISGLAERPYTQISGGERQLTFIARALMQEPKILLLDEPVAHLDIKNKVKVLTIVRDIAREKNLTVLMSLHDPNDAIKFSHKIVLIKDGTIIDYGSVEKIIDEKNLKKIYDIEFDILGTDTEKVIMYKISTAPLDRNETIPA